MTQSLLGLSAGEIIHPQQMDEYKGIWYANQKTNDEYVYKYSGGLGTYCAKHIPLAVYSEAAGKTFFVYGGVHPDSGKLAEMVAFYDHKTDTFSKPGIIMDKGTEDAHDNPVISLDEMGHVWVFASAHGTARPGYIFKSVEPFDISAFEVVQEVNFSYPQPWHIPGKGFLFLHTFYEGGRSLQMWTSADGRDWSDRKLLARMGEGHYQVSWPKGDTVGTAFNYHPKGKGLNHRTNLYYMQSSDMGETWQTIGGQTLETPLLEVDTPALVHDYESEGLNVYMKDLNYDADGNPIILYLVSRGWEPGPENGPRTWRIAKWNGADWSFHDIAESDNNYDMGSLLIEANEWKLVAPTETGPQAFNPGGEVALWTSHDEGEHWQFSQNLTRGSPQNHSYVRRPLNAHSEFQVFWADGHGRQFSDSNLYFWNRDKGEVKEIKPAF